MSADNHVRDAFDSFMAAQGLSCGSEFELAKQAFRAGVAAGEGIKEKKRTRHKRLDCIINTVNTVLGADVMTQSRRREFTIARHAAIYFCRKYTGASVSTIAELFERDHSLVTYAVSAVKDRMSIDPPFRSEMASLEIAVFRDLCACDSKSTSRLHDQFIMEVGRG